MSAAVRLLRACAKADLTLRETISVFQRVRRGQWSARNNRELLAQGEYLKSLSKQREARP